MEKFNMPVKLPENSHRFKSVSIELTSLFKKYELLNFPSITLNNVNDSDSNIQTKISIKIAKLCI